MIRAAWLSANLFGYELLKEAIKIKDFEIQVIFTLSKQSITKMYDPVDQEKWYGFGIPVCEISNINNEIELLKSYSVDLVVMCGWRQIINKALLNTPQRGIIGFHPTMLPVGRGSAPIINTILEGYHESGVTLYYISEGLDDGDIIGQESFIVGQDDNANNIYEKVMLGGKQLIRSYFPLLVEGNAPCIPQKNSEATFFPKRTINDNEINLENDSVEVIYKKIRAFSKPYNGAYIIKDNKKIIFWNAEIQENL